MKKLFLMLLFLALPLAPLACGEADLPMEPLPNPNDAASPGDMEPAPLPSPSPIPDPTPDGENDDDDGPQYYPAPHWEFCVIGEPGCGGYSIQP